MLPRSQVLMSRQSAFVSVLRSWILQVVFRPHWNQRRGIGVASLPGEHRESLCSCCQRGLRSVRARLRGVGLSAFIANEFLTHR